MGAVRKGSLTAGPTNLPPSRRSETCPGMSSTVQENRQLRCPDRKQSRNPSGPYRKSGEGPDGSGRVLPVRSVVAGVMAKKRSDGGIKTNSSTESYAVGQVADSLFRKETAKAKTTPLMTLFSTPLISTSQLLFTPVLERKVSGKKRKIPEEPAGRNEGKQQKLEEVKPVQQKKLTAAEQKLAQRESALSAADTEGEGVRRVKQRKKLTEDGPLAAVEQTTGKAAKRLRKRRTNRGMEKIKNKRTVFVGNLPAEYSKQMVIALFKEFGPIESVRIRSVAREEPSISKKLATIQNGYELKSGFNIRVDLAIKSDVYDHRRSIFLGNLSYDIQENDVRDHFCGCGDIKWVRIVRDQESGMGKGFGYVLFQSMDAVTLALELNNSELQGRKVRVSRSVKKERVSQDPAVSRHVEKEAAARDFAGLMVKKAESKKTKRKIQGKKIKQNRRKVSKSKKQ
ncbi:RNA-binding protein 34 isoform X2 [Mobula birostris]|uniref:RNA-binding protein 34 isoform X2 n=1 Tax=Mobula birostris TaxID=1983395 RepID=UPI003B27B8C7